LSTQSTGDQWTKGVVEVPPEAGEAAEAADLPTLAEAAAKVVVVVVAAATTTRRRIRMLQCHHVVLPRATAG